MMRWIFLVALLLSGCDWLTPDAVDVNVSLPTEDERLISGLIIENSVQSPADGNDVLTIETDEGVVDILYFEGGLVPLEMQADQCTRNSQADVIRQFPEGLEVTVFAYVDADGLLNVCSGSQYYVLVDEDTSVDLRDNQRVNALYWSGVIIDGREDCVVDGICSYFIENGDGIFEVIWSEGDTPICSNNPIAAIDRPLEFGDAIRAYGRIVQPYVISACGHEAFYIRPI